MREIKAVLNVCIKQLTRINMNNIEAKLDGLLKDIDQGNITKENIPGYKQNPPDWCDDCNAAPGGECPDCGCTHNC
jgi:hypothetical protein